MKEALLAKISDHSALVAVVGLGYVGLPFAVEKAKVGYRVIGIDRSESRVRKINEGINYVPDVDSDELSRLVREGKITAHKDFSGISDADVIVIAVPTPLSKNLTPDLQYVESVTAEVAKYLRPGQLISLESTTYPGTTEEIMLPLLEETKLRVEQDFFLAHSPERVDPGNRRYTTKNTNKVVGGVGVHSQEVALHFYSQTIEKVVPVSSAKAAELTKVFENTFRAVNIALVNELAMLCDRLDISVWEVLDAAFTKPFGILPFYPGPGVGGHCIPIDPHYLEWKAKELNFETHFIALAGEINRRMPEFVIQKAARCLNKNGIALSQAKVLVLGVAYKKDLGDVRESPALEIIRGLRREGASVSYSDPFVPVLQDAGTNLENLPIQENPRLLSEFDLVLIATDHSNVNYTDVVENSRRVLDTRNATRQVQNKREIIDLL